MGQPIDSAAFRAIVFDEEELGSHGGRRTNAAVALLTIAHEVGHHVCGHTVSQHRVKLWEMELEADQVAGAILVKSAWSSFFWSVRGWRRPPVGGFLGSRQEDPRK